MASSRQSRTCCQAYAKCAGARTANSQPPQRPAISFTCLRSCRTWRSIRQIRNRSDGSWCEARRLRSWSIFQRTRGDRFQTLGMRPWVSRFTITRNDGSKPGTKAHLDETDTQAFRLPDERFGRSVLSRPLSCSGVFRGSRYPLEASYGEAAVQLVTLYGHLRSSNHLVGNIVWHLRQAARALLKGARSKATVPTSPIRECGWPRPRRNMWLRTGRPRSGKAFCTLEGIRWCC
jgi:hypothetical protein